MDEEIVTKVFRFTRLEEIEVPARLLEDDPDGELAEKLTYLARAALDENVGYGVSEFFELTEVE